MCRRRSGRIGDPLEPATRLGPMVSEDHLATVLGYLDIAEREGAKVLTGGSRVRRDDLPAGPYMQPTVLVDVANSMRCVREEIFGRYWPSCRSTT